MTITLPVLVIDSPVNYKEVVGENLIQCARFISENNIQDAVNMAEKYYNKAGLKWSGKELKATKREFKICMINFLKCLLTLLHRFLQKTIFLKIA